MEATQSFAFSLKMLRFFLQKFYKLLLKSGVGRMHWKKLSIVFMRKGQ